MHGPRPGKELKEQLILLQNLERRATEIIQGMPTFAFSAFEAKFFSRESITAIKDLLNEYATRLRRNEQIGSAITYECAASSLNKFKPNVKLDEITPDNLRKYEKWMLDEGKSITTVGMYLRCVRSVFNKAINDGLIAKELYPFGRRKYEVPTGNNIKKALAIADIAKIYSYETEPYSTIDMARDYWIFLYLCNGMNVKDFSRLKYENIKGDTLSFIRAKSARTKRHVEPIRVPLLEDARRIIEKWGQPPKYPETFIFPILKKGITPERERQLIQQKIHVINEHLRTVAGDLGIESLTTYTARHSYATILKRSGASTEFISEALGHSNLKTTQNYLASFEDDQKREIAQALTAFKNDKG